MPLPTLAKTTLFHLLRTGFRLLPLPAAARDRMRQRFLERHSDLVPAGPRGQIALGTQQEHRPRIVAGGPAIGYRHRTPGELPDPMPATLVAFYLPQFHPIPENDAWWGTGFTEWKNVARALPQFEGHAQPRLPGELGFYDLRVADVMRQQMQLAREYGIGAFCSYFYWFGGKTLLEQPLQQWLSDPTMDLPLCLCWANENWSRRWDGRADEILIGQQHSAEDDLAFIAHVARYLADPRYLRVDGKPMLLVYRPGLLPEPSATAARWRSWCRQAGLGEIYLAYVQSFDRIDPRKIGFDAAVAFPPNNTTLKPITSRQRLLNPDFHGDVYDWRELARTINEQPEPDYTLFPCVNPGWDNEPRRSGNGRIFAHASPRAYGDWLQTSIAAVQRRKPSSPLVFVNAWNEWAEGAVLEPDTRLGFAWLEATRTTLKKTAGADPTLSRPCAVIHAWYTEVVDEIIASLKQTAMDWRIVFTTTPDREEALQQRVALAGLQAEIHVFENRGRDILPFLRIADRLLDENVDVVLKLHTKRTLHRDDGSQWRQELLQKLLAGDRGHRVWQAFKDQPSLGIAAAEGHILPVSRYIGGNESAMKFLLPRLGLAGPTNDTPFVAGSMFWARLAALRPLLDANFGTWEFEAENGQVDGTLAHALERTIGLAVSATGFEIKDIASICGIPVNEPSTDVYPYAHRT
jgi:lipopolysaccharide biosynthesis protein